VIPLLVPACSLHPRCRGLKHGSIGETVAQHVLDVRERLESPVGQSATLSQLSLACETCVAWAGTAPLATLCFCLLGLLCSAGALCTMLSSHAVHYLCSHFDRAQLSCGGACCRREEVAQATGNMSLWPSQDCPAHWSSWSGCMCVVCAAPGHAQFYCAELCVLCSGITSSMPDASASLMLFCS
jgi:hypothetical protein